jgi:hypothetical protein
MRKLYGEELFRYDRDGRGRKVSFESKATSLGLLLSGEKSRLRKADYLPTYVETDE